MKFNYDEEFDLQEIYRKLTSKSQPSMVKASEFFDKDESCNLYKLQAVAARLIALSKRV